MKTIFTIVMLLCTKAAFSQNYPITEIPENLLKNANAVIRESSENYVFKSVNDLDIQQKHVVTVLNKTGDDFAGVYIHYNPETRVSDIKVNLYDSFGKLIKNYSKKDFSDYTYNRSGALYVDNRILILIPKSTAYPFTVETMYETHTSNTIYINYFSPFDSFDVALQKATFRIVNNSGIKVRSKILDNEFGKVKFSESGNISEYSYENIPAIKEQDLSPTISYLKPKVEFSPEYFSLAGIQGDLSSWNSYGKWYNEKLLKPSSEVTPEISKEIASLNLSGTTSEKVKKIYQYMQNKTRYVLVTMGIGGWKPINADEVGRKGYGDCKGLSNYMRTLLTAAGIKSYYAEIYDDKTEHKFDKNFVKPNGNHVILMVPTENGNIWLENTSQKIAFNHLSYTSHNRNVLAVKENGIEIIDTPVYKPEESKEMMNASIKLNEDATITSNVNFVYTGGQYDMALYFTSLKNEELKDAIKNIYYSLKIGEVSVENLNNNRDNAEISFDMKLKANDFSKKLGNDIFFPVMPFGKTSTIISNDERVLPFETSFPFQDDYKIEYSAPIGFQFSDIPKSVNFTSEFGTYSMNFEQKDDKLIVHRVLTINKGLYPKEKFKEYAAFKKKASNIDNTKILIKKL